MVLSAVGTVASGALSGAGGEMGRRASERLYGLLSRARADGGAGAAAGSVDGGERRPALPVTEPEQTAAALRLTELARSSPEFARDVAEFRRLPNGGDSYNAGRVYMSLGEAHLQAGDVDLARVCLDEAVQAMTEDGAGLQLADAAETRASCHRLSHRPAEERADLRTAAARYEEHGDHAGLDRVRARLAELGE
ncbi:hypothetical protein [Streptomyces sp. NPDC007205]|uniref:hypothetical protein n=1 Tax=Streptomyces sp. NPDC007205 TaxID=3154316 RepID=UPI0033D11958